MGWLRAVGGQGGLAVGLDWGWDPQRTKPDPKQPPTPNPQRNPKSQRAVACTPWPQRRQARARCPLHTGRGTSSWLRLGRQGGTRRPVAVGGGAERLPAAGGWVVSLLWGGGHCCDCQCTRLCRCCCDNSWCRCRRGCWLRGCWHFAVRGGGKGQQRHRQQRDEKRGRRCAAVPAQSRERAAPPPAAGGKPWPCGAGCGATALWWGAAAAAAVQQGVGDASRAAAGGAGSTWGGRALRHCQCYQPVACMQVVVGASAAMRAEVGSMGCCELHAWGLVLAHAAAAVHGGGEARVRRREPAGCRRCRQRCWHSPPSCCCCCSHAAAARSLSGLGTLSLGGAPAEQPDPGGRRWLGPVGWLCWLCCCLMCVVRCVLGCMQAHAIYLHGARRTCQ